MMRMDLSGKKDGSQQVRSPQARGEKDELTPN